MDLKYKLLLKNPKININLQDFNGNTALHIACENNNIDLTMLLLECLDIDINLKNKSGKTAYQLTTSYEIKREINKEHYEMYEIPEGSWYERIREVFSK